MIRSDFRTLDAYIDYRIKATRYARDWAERNPQKIKLYRARSRVVKQLQRIDSLIDNRTELQVLLELPQSILVYVHETYPDKVRADIKRLEVSLEQAIKRFERLVVLRDEEEARHGPTGHRQFK